MKGSLEKIYAKVPEVHCKGLCHEACGPIPLGKREAHLAQLTKHVSHVTLSGTVFPLLVNEATGFCPFLTREKRCGIYERRPLICRLYGVVAGMGCPFDCVPEREITDGFVVKLMKSLEA